MQEYEIIKLAEEMGFTAAYIDTADVVQDPSFRKFCEDNLCGKYNANYACPPDCGTVDEVQQRLKAGKRALVLQSIWDIGSYDNKDGIQKSKKTHNAAILRFTETLRQAGHKGFCLGYGGCPLCDPCKRVTNEPCVHPEQKISCMSAYCIDVAKLAEKCSLEFAWVPEKLFLFGMFVFA